MPKKLVVKRNEYHDSVQLMIVSEQIRKMQGVTQAMVSMGTETNKQVFRDLGLMGPEGESATVNDMVLAIEADSEGTIYQAMKEMEGLFHQRAVRAGRKAPRHTFEAALRAMPDANLCVITVPGEYAVAEARKALEVGLHVLIFSDNVPLEEEREIKELAHTKGLLCMGPDCGVANINGFALATASVVRKGPIGIAGASGSGTQQITVLVEKEGLGVSQAIGVGGKDLNDAVGGLSMLAAIDALEEDPATKVIVLVSRTPGAKTLSKITGRVKQCRKPVVVYFIAGDPEVIRKVGGIPASDLEDAAHKAVNLDLGNEFRTSKFSLPGEDIRGIITRETEHMAPEQKYLRGIFCGGTFCEEAMAVLNESVGDIYSNTPLRPDLKLENSGISKEHSVVDLGDEEFTLGRPHPVIDPEPRRRQILQEGNDPEVAVLLLDFILGHAVHPDPVGAMAEVIALIKDEREKRGGYLSIVASVCGTEGDPQRLSVQEQTLREVGVVVMPSNAQAARLAGMVVQAAAARG